MPWKSTSTWGTLIRKRGNHQYSTIYLSFLNQVLLTRNRYKLVNSIFFIFMKMERYYKSKFLWSVQWSIIPIKNLTSLFPLIFLSQHISLYALHRLQGILDIIWPLNRRFNLKNKRNWIKQVLMLKLLIGIICILLHRSKKLILIPSEIPPPLTNSFFLMWF